MGKKQIKADDLKHACWVNRAVIVIYLLNTSFWRYFYGNTNEYNLKKTVKQTEQPHELQINSQSQLETLTIVTR